MDLSIIIVNYNVQFFLENCLNSVFQALQNMDAEVIVVDNNSVDGSLKMLEEKFPQVKLIANKDNLGFSKANNQAIKEAKGEIVLLLNPDTVVEENTFEVCLEIFKNNPKVGGLGLKMLDGKGNFLPESKRGLPTPSVAFHKIFGLSALFPKSRIFNKYHLGYLSKDEDHEIEILSGAFMMIRKKVLDEIGLLDELFFMYGEDIDLSYRITQSGYINWYTSKTSIIHYKGESTKKSSINYVFVFYKAMAIFAKKHFSQKNARLFSLLIHLAIYFRAGLALATRFIKHFVLPVFDFIILISAIYWFKDYYEGNVKFTEGGAYPSEVETYGIPIISLFYLFSLFINGGYSIPTKFSSIVKGVFSGSLLLLISYSLLDENYRFSRAIILFSILWSLFTIPLYRYLFHLIGFRKIKQNKAQRIAIVGKKDEINRIKRFLNDTLIDPEVTITINATNEDDGDEYTAKLNQLLDIVEIYQINEIIFCSKDLSAKSIIQIMGKIVDEKVNFKIAPPESLYIIGSNSIESSGDYYIIGSNAIVKPVNQRNKRLLDFSFAILLLLLSPILLIFNSNIINYYSNLIHVLGGKLSLVGFNSIFQLEDPQLKIKKGILTPLDLHDKNTFDEHNVERLNFQYARDYKVNLDIEIILKNLSSLSRKVNIQNPE